MGASICHIELPVRNMARAKKFYGGLFGWKFRGFSPTYVMFNPGDGVGGALKKIDAKAEGAGENATAIYVKVESIQQVLKQSKEYGVKVLLRRTEIGGGNGYIAHLLDPEGNTIGLWSAG